MFGCGIEVMARNKPKVDCRTCRHFHVVGRGVIVLTWKCGAGVFGCLSPLSTQPGAKTYGEYIGCDRFQPLRLESKRIQLALFDTEPFSFVRLLSDLKLGERFTVRTKDKQPLSLVCIDHRGKEVIGIDDQYAQWIVRVKSGIAVRYEW